MNYDVIFLEVLQWNTPEISIVPPLLILAVHKPVMSNYQTEKKTKNLPIILSKVNKLQAFTGW